MQRKHVVIGCVAIIIGMSIALVAMLMESRTGHSTPATTAMVWVGMAIALVGGGVAALLARGR